MSLSGELKSFIDIESQFMRDFQKKAPGTYRHCDTVAQLVDSVCNELPHLNRDALYPAAMLHDVGKTLNPEYFCENQPKGENIHDELDPSVSYQFISRHVSDSLMLLIQHTCVPRLVLEIISQHHGNSAIKSLCRDSKAPPFRYAGKPPQTPEACVLMLCDSIEAAARSKFTNNKLDDIDHLVKAITEDRIEDKQLDNLKIGELRVIREVLIKEIGKMYHKRVEYPEEGDNNNGIET